MQELLTDLPEYVILFLSRRAQEPIMNDETKDLILGVFEASLEAQLRAVRRLRQGEQESAEPRRRKGLSQVDMAFDILKKARSPLHVSEILNRIQSQFGVAVDRESLVSSLTKKVARGDRFLRPERNTFSLRPEPR
jgi:HB1, ASXL, restriction endonuclease HTH domain